MRLRRPHLPLALVLTGALYAPSCLGQPLFVASQTPNCANPGSATWFMAVGHFDGDSHLDLAVSLPYVNGISVLLGRGDGTFTCSSAYFAGSSPYGLAVADFNGDGNQDLGVANEDGGVFVFLGNGSGAFTALPELPAGDSPRYLVAADFDEDGDADLAAANQFSDDVSVLLGNGNGTFQTAVSHPVDDMPRGIVAADFNSDSHPDLAIATRGAYTISLLPGNGDGTFQSQISFPINNLGRPSPLVTADFDGDGHRDLAVGADSDEGLNIYLGNGDGTFGPGLQYRTSAGGAPWEVAIGDFNGDGIPDLVTAEGYDDVASVLLGVGNGTFSPRQSFPSGTFTLSVAAGDFNGDGYDDVAVGHDGMDQITILMNQAPFPGTCTDADGDGFGSPGDPSCPAGAVTDCNDASAAISPLASDPCDGLDNNCDLMDGYDWDLDDYTSCGADCDDTRSHVYPGAMEWCNGIDEDCNGTVDLPAEEARNLDFGSSSTTFTWTSPNGLGTTYNVYRGVLGLGPFSYNQTCFQSALTQLSASDSDQPLPGQRFHYLVSGENRCGEGTLGGSSSGAPRPNTLPCP